MNRASRKTKQIVVIAFAVLAVGVMVAALVLLVDFRSSGKYRAGEVSMPSDSTVPDPTPSVWPSDWPVSPSPAPEGVTAGEGSFIFPDTVPRTDPEAVAKAFAELTVSWDTAIDSGTEAGLERAMPFVAEDGNVVTGGSGVGAGWVNASGHDAYTVPDARVLPFHAEDEHAGELVFAPTGEPIEPFTLEASYSWQGRDGWVSSSSASRAVYLSLVEREGEWWVVEYGFVDPPLDAIAE